MEYQLYHPSILGEPIGIISDKGKVVEAVNPIVKSQLEWIIAQLKRGVATHAANNWKAIPLPYKSAKAVTLSKLFAKQNRSGKAENLKIIQPGNLFTGRNWNNLETRERISQMDKDGLSIRQMAEQLDVSLSTLVRANQKHNLYPARNNPVQ